MGDNLCRHTSGIGNLRWMLLYFADETGDPGVKPGASATFGVCLLRVEPEVGRRISATLEGVRRQLGLADTHEFKWSRNPIETRLQALEAVGVHDFRFQARIWGKQVDLVSRMGGPFLEVELIRQCLRDFGAPFPPAKLFVDGARDRRRAARIRNGLRDQLDPSGRPCIHEVRLQDSASSDLLQMADLLAGWSANPGSGTRVAYIRRTLSPKGSVADWP